MNFTQTSSFIKQFRGLLIALGLLLFIESAGTFLSSQNFLRGLTELSQINKITELAYRGSTNITSARHTLERLVNESHANPLQLIPVYEASEQEAAKALDEALRLNIESPKVRGLLEDANENIRELNQTAAKIFADTRAGTVDPESSKSTLLLIKQFELDASESLRGAQIELARIGNESFSNIYRSRFTPLLVSLALALVSFVTVLIIGFRSTRRVNRSLENLINVTDQVGRGNFGIQVPILGSDEIGRLTAAFDQMLQSLNKSIEAEKSAAEKTTRLQNITAAFSKALAPKEVGDIVVEQGMAAFKAHTGSVMLFTTDETSLEILSSLGRSESTLARWRRFPLSQYPPIESAIRFNTPVFLEYSAAIPGLEAAAVMIIPLSSDGRVIGTLNFSFPYDRAFSKEERELAVALGDLTSQALLRSKLYTDAQKAIHIRDEFLSIASHELKTPITSLKMQIQFVSRQIKGTDISALSPQRLVRMLDVSSAQVNRLVQLVDDLLDITRIEAGKLTFDFKDTDLSELTDGIIERFSDLFRGEQSPIETEIEKDVIAHCDPFRIEQVIINLLSNAMKYGPGKPIRISLNVEGPHAKISVKDQGIGIPYEKLSVIFNRFERIASNRSVGGLGLGLYISQQIIDAHHGTISVESAIDQGSTFTIRIPIKPRALTSTS